MHMSGHQDDQIVSASTWSARRGEQSQAGRASTSSGSDPPNISNPELFSSSSIFTATATGFAFPTGALFTRFEARARAGVPSSESRKHAVSKGHRGQCAFSGSLAIGRSKRVLDTATHQRGLGGALGLGDVGDACAVVDDVAAARAGRSGTGRRGTGRRRQGCFLLGEADARLEAAGASTTSLAAGRGRG